MTVLGYYQYITNTIIMQRMFCSIRIFNCINLIDLPRIQPKHAVAICLPASSKC